jgi:hypothetical protein
MPGSEAAVQFAILQVPYFTCQGFNSLNITSSIFHMPGAEAVVQFELF